MVSLSRVFLLTNLYLIFSLQNLSLNPAVEQSSLQDKERKAPDDIIFQPPFIKINRFGLYPCSLAATEGMSFTNFEKLWSLVLFSSAYWNVLLRRVRSTYFYAVLRFFRKEFPHSEISGSKVARHLPEAYRSHATSFIASISQGIHHLLIK